MTKAELVARIAKDTALTKRQSAEVLHAIISSVQEALASTTTRPVPANMPTVIVEDGKRRVYLPGDPDSGWDVPDNLIKA